MAVLSKNYRPLKTAVRRRFGPELFDDLLLFLISKDLVLWSTDKPKNLEELCLVLALHHDMDGKGWRWIKDTYSLPCRLSAVSMIHNARQIRWAARPWTDRFIRLGSKDEWRDSFDFDEPPVWCRLPTLWIDSVDIRYQKWRGCSRKEDYWSYKENGPGLRFMTLQDGSGYIRRVWGGYSLKTHDTDFLKVYKDWFLKKLKGVTVLADNHFYWGVHHLRPVNFQAPKANPAKKKSADHSGPVPQLTKEQTRRNREIREIRQRVERPYAHIKNNWKSLAVPWKEGPDTLKDVYYLAIAWHNNKIYNSKF